MISVFKSLSTGTKRALIVGGILSSLLAGHSMDFGESWLAATLIIWLPVYCMLVAMGLWVYSGYVDDSDNNDGELEEMADAVTGSIRAYKEAKQEYSKQSKEQLLDGYSEMKRESKEDMERLALEDELVERGMLDESQMRKKNKI
jgi:hypothetical protein